jgi:hypothetical protein
VVWEPRSAGNANGRPTAKPQSHGKANGAIVIASFVPVTATVAQANDAVVHVETGYPFTDSVRITVTTKDDAATMDTDHIAGGAPATTIVKIRIPAWAVAATVNGSPAPNGTLVATSCGAGKTTIMVELNPAVVIERGWGHTLNNNKTIAWCSFLNRGFTRGCHWIQRVLA